LGGPCCYGHRATWNRRSALMLQFSDEIDRTVRAIWATVFDLDLCATAEVTADDLQGVTGLVTLDGAFKGAVLVQCSNSLAEDLTAQLVGTSATTDRQDVSDALGELANITAGNLKPALPGPCQIGLPVVTFGSDYEIRVLGTRPVGLMQYRCRGQAMAVTLVEDSAGTGVCDDPAR
jgi:chemotaxis protein CheX